MSSNNFGVLPPLLLLALFLAAASPASAALTYQDLNDTFHNFTYLYNGIKLQLRSCNSLDCSGSPNFIGPDNSTSSWFNNSNYNGLRTVNLSAGRYFQYKAYLWTDNTTASPRLWNVSLAFQGFDIDTPTISPSEPAWATSQLSCSALAYNPNGTSFTASFRWYNGTALYGESNTSSSAVSVVVSNSLTAATQKAGETWNCSVAAFQGTQQSSWKSAARYVNSTPAGYYITVDDVFHSFKWLYNNIKLQLRSCSLWGCSDNPNFIGPDNSTASWFNNSNYNDLPTVNLSRTRYFQYKAYLWTDNTTVSPGLWNVSMAYSDLQAPGIGLLLPQNTTYSTTSLSLNYMVSDQNLDKVWYLYNSVNATLTGNTTFTALNNQQSTLYVYANDTAGNVNVTNVTFTVDTIAPSVALTSPANNTGSTTGNMTLNYTASDSGLANCFLMLQGSVNQTSLSNFTLNYLPAGRYNWTVTCQDAANNNVTPQVREFSVALASRFNVTPDLGSINVTNATLELATRSGRIYFPSVDLGGGADIDSYVNISSNRIEVNSPALPALNTPATLYLYNLTFSNPKILRDGGVCPSSICAYGSYSGGVLTFNVTQFSVYSSEETPVTATAAPTTVPVAGGGGGGRKSWIDVLSIVPPEPVLTGETAKVELLLKNTGDYDETNVNIAIGDCPAGWKCGSATVSKMAVGAESRVILEITPSLDAVANRTYSLTARVYSTSREFSIEIKPQCAGDSDCYGQSEKCINNRCVKLFDIKILRVDSPIKPGENLDFTYFMKGMADVSGDVVVDFWLEDKAGRKVVEGSHTIYLGKFEEKTESAGMFLYSDMPVGRYRFYVRLNLEGHLTTAYVPVEVGYEVPLMLDTRLSDMNAVNFSEPFNFSLVLGFNKDEPAPLYVDGKLVNLGNKQVVWHNAYSLVINRTTTITEGLPPLTAGRYQLEFVAGYGVNKTAIIVRSFEVEAPAAVTMRTYDIYVLSVLLVFALLLLAILAHWERKRIEEVIEKEKTWIERRESFISALALIVAIGTIFYVLLKLGIVQKADVEKVAPLVALVFGLAVLLSIARMLFRTRIKVPPVRPPKIFELCSGFVSRTAEKARDGLRKVWQAMTTRPPRPPKPAKFERAVVEKKDIAILLKTAENKAKENLRGVVEFCSGFVLKIAEKCRKVWQAMTTRPRQPRPAARLEEKETKKLVRKKKCITLLELCSGFVMKAVERAKESIVKHKKALLFAGFVVLGAVFLFKYGAALAKLYGPAMAKSVQEFFAAQITVPYIHPAALVAALCIILAFARLALAISKCGGVLEGMAEPHWPRAAAIALMIAAYSFLVMLVDNDILTGEFWKSAASFYPFVAAVAGLLLTAAVVVYSVRPE